MLSPPISPKQAHSLSPEIDSSHGKPRSRFSEFEDTVICEGVAKGLTWGQISNQLPHRKRATCFNRYRTLQGIRKSRKRSSVRHTEPKPASLTLNTQLPSSSQAPTTPGLLNSPTTPTPASSPLSSWTPTTPPSEMISYPVYSHNEDPLIRRLSCPSKDHRTVLPPIFHRRPTAIHLPYLA